MKSRADMVKKALNEALKNSQSITIRYDGDKGTLIICVAHREVVTYKDVYDGIEELMPQLMGELT